MNIFSIWLYGKERQVVFALSQYGKTGNLYVELIDVSDPEAMVPCYELTYRFAKLPYYHAALNEDSEGIGEALELIGAGKITGRVFETNVREYREFEFDPEFLRENVPKEFHCFIK